MNLQTMLEEGQALWPRPLREATIKRFFNKHTNGKLGNVSLDTAWQARKLEHTNWWKNRFKDQEWAQYEKLTIWWEYKYTTTAKSFTLWHTIKGWQTPCKTTLLLLPASEAKLQQYLAEKLRQLSASYECVQPTLYDVVKQPVNKIVLLSKPEFKV